MITNENGLVAVRHWNSNPADAIINNTAYHFQPRSQVSLAWVKPEHVAQIVAIRAKICCNQYKAKFRIANQNDVNIWNNGSLRGD